MRAALITAVVGALLVVNPGGSRGGLQASGQSPASGPRSLDLTAAGDAGAKLPRLRSLLVGWRGDLVLERYYNGASRERLANIKSASKSVISTLVGIALDRKLIADVNTPIVTWFPELANDRDPAKRAITLEHLLAMRSGLEGTSGRNYGAWVTSKNWVQHALARPMFAPSGLAMEYSTGNTHLLSAILTKASGKSTWQFANEVLAKPLGFTLAQWPRDPQGVYFGGNDMLMTPRQLLLLGQMYLTRGRANGQQLVSARWVERSCDGRARAPRPWNGNADPMRDRKYGLGWWVYEVGGYDTCFAWGYGGQYVFVVPALDLVVVTTASPDVSEERRGHRQIVFDILDRLVVEPIARAQ